MTLACAETVTVVRQTEDNFGDRTAGAMHAVDGCAIWPITTNTELVFGQDTITSGLTVLMPPGSDILATDRVIARGETFEVFGVPAVWRSAINAFEPGIQVTLQLVTG